MLPYYYGIDITYIIIVLPAIIFAMIMQARVNSVYAKFSGVSNSRGMAGAEIAERVLKSNGVYDVRIERTEGTLSDHYDPRKKVIRLSGPVYGGSSVAAAGIAAHECGHAIQYDEGYGPIRIRNAIIPVSQFGSMMAFPLILLGFFLSYQSLVNIGILFFAAAVAFQLITLPVEFNASRRALAALDNTNILSGNETQMAKKVLSAAAMTYVAALAVSLAQLLRLLVLFGGFRRRD